MTIPFSSQYPEKFDTNQNLYQVRDSLRVRLIEDYNPGDKSIVVLGDESIMRSFDSTGIITLTEQCNESEFRGISFYYGSKTLTTFDQLELLPEFTDVVKPKNITDVTQNVMSVHHNSIKDALIAIQKFAGKKDEIINKPLEGTMEQRINYLRKLALSPKAWFKANKIIGLAPLTVEFEDQSFRLGGDGNAYTVEHIWDFGDNSGPSIITINENNEVPSNVDNVLVLDSDGGKIKKTYTRPGIYSVTLTVKNEFGSDSVTFDDIIQARFPAPDSAVIGFVQRAGQLITDGDPEGGPYTTPPKIRATTNSIIDISIPSGVNSYTGKTYSGESVVPVVNTPIDPIKSYTWSLSDDLSHKNSSSARAVFSIGGTYDLNLRVDTEFGAYRITTYENSIDIVERVNLWLWTFNNNSNNVSSYEFGLISETFKIKGNRSLALETDNSFLNGQNNETQQKKEFSRNNGFSQRGSATSGSGGTGLLYWASGRSALQSTLEENILISEYNGFEDTYLYRSPINRPWNWIGISSTENVYFFLGGKNGIAPPNTSPTNQNKSKLSLSTLSVIDSTLTSANYKNGADELMNNEVGNPVEWNMSVYRSTWHEEAGYFLRNEGVNDFFRIKSFYKTSGNSSEPFQDIRKLPDMIGSAKTEGQLVSLSQGVYFFSNSGSVAAYNPISGIWSTGGPGNNSVYFSSLQDTSVVGFDNINQTFVATSDKDRTAYLSFDYSPNSFIKFNEADTTFSSVSSRPSGNQWQISIF